jgi:hypothetical protein
MTESLRDLPALSMGDFLPIAAAVEVAPVNCSQADLEHRTKHL